MTTDSIFKKDEGKKRITAAVAGLLIVLSSWLILNQINPKIFENDITLGKLDKNKLKTGMVPLVGVNGVGEINVNNVKDIPDYKGSEEFTSSGEGYTPTLTAYSPQKNGSNIVKMEGDYKSSQPGLDGRNVVRTLDDYNEGRSSYITLAGDPSQRGKAYIIPTITYKNSSGKTITLTNVKGYVHDTGDAFKGKGNSKFDIPIGKDYNDIQMNTQPFNGNEIQFIPAIIEGYDYGF